MEEQPEPPRRGGRPRDPAWEQCIVEDNVVSCKKCEKIIHTYGYHHVERVRLHLEKKCAKRQRLQPITTFFPFTLDPTVRADFERLLARWAFRTGVSLHAISHEDLAAAFAVLHPELRPPTDHALRNRLLNEAYARSLEMIKASLTGLMCSLTTDGWTDVNGKAVINYMVVRGAISFFLESRYTGATSHDAQFLAEDIERVINKYDFLTITSVVTDNTSANQSMWVALEPKYPRMFFHGCASHAVHLLTQDVIQGIKWLRELVDGCKRLVKFIKKHHLLHAESSAASRLF